MGNTLASVREKKPSHFPPVVKVASICLVVAAGGACGDEPTGATNGYEIELVVPSAEVVAGASVALSAIVRDGGGRVVQGAGVTWSVSDSSRALVRPDGIFIGTDTGSVTVTAEAFSRSGSALIRVTGPAVANPIRILGQGGVWERFTAEVAVRGPWAYTTTWGLRGTVRGNAIKVWDVSGPTPILVDSVILQFATQVGDVQISDDGALLMVATERSGGSIVLFDLSNPARPTQLSRHSTTSTAVGVHTAKFGRVNGVLHAFLSVNQSVLPSQLVIVDLSNPANPTEVLVRPMGAPFIHDVFVRDEILFTALWNGGLTTWDLGGLAAGGSVANPVQVGNVLTVNGSVHNAWWFHDPHSASKQYVFVGEEGPGTVGYSSSGDIHVVDVSDMSNPREVAFFHATPDPRGRPVGTHNFWVDEANGVLYAAFYNGGIRAIDIRGDLSTCPAEHRAPDQRCDLVKMGRELSSVLAQAGDVFIWGVQQEGANLYASDMLNGLWKLDVSALRGR